MSRNLSLYFDDQKSPENCGHCSVCRGQTAKLEYSTISEMPNDELLKGYLSALIAQLKTKTNQPLSVETLTRFLTGLMVPIFSRNKVKQLPGFACCENIRFQEVKNKVMTLQ